MKGRTVSHTKKKELFLDRLSLTANISKACKLARIPRRTIYEWREADKEFSKRWDAAIELSTDALEDEAVRRATDGTMKPVFQQGRRVGYIREMSDTLLIFMLKARRPKRFRDNIKIDANVTGGVLVVGAPATSKEDWAKKYAKAG